jgi:hypothetical protein
MKTEKKGGKLNVFECSFFWGDPAREFTPPFDMAAGKDIAGTYTLKTGSKGYPSQVAFDLAGGKSGKFIAMQMGPRGPATTVVGKWSVDGNQLVLKSDQETQAWQCLVSKCDGFLECQQVSKAMAPTLATVIDPAAGTWERQFTGPVPAECGASK